MRASENTSGSIATEPNADQTFATASFTSLRGAKDQTVTLMKAEHPLLKWDTCISYALAEIVTAEKLQTYLEQGRAKNACSATPAVLRLILDGFLASDSRKQGSGFREAIQTWRDEWTLSRAISCPLARPSNPRARKRTPCDRSQLW
jgi:hypothetical protein